MNSEELEQSLRTEFEDYLKLVFADVQQEVAALQEKVEGEFERHRTQLTEAFEDFSRRADGSRKEPDAGFRSSVVEHLRLARDEGARITATAIAEAEAMEKEAAAEVAEQAAANAVRYAGIGELRDGISDICSQTSQAAILKSLVAHAEQFTPRGAFFIVKNEHLVGWRVFGRDEQQADADQTIREIFFPVSEETTLGESLKSLGAVESAYGSNAGDASYLEKLNFGEPEKIIAIPLVARGRGVAVLYADAGENGSQINVEALDTLVRVAGLTVELLAAASSSTAAPQSARQAPATYAPQTNNFTEKSAQAEQNEEAASETYQADEPQQAETTTDYGSAVEAADRYADSSETSENAYSSESDYQPEAAASDASSDDYATTDYSFVETVPEFEAPAEQEAEAFAPASQAEETESYSWNQPAETVALEEETRGEAAQTEDYSDYGAAKTESYADYGAAPESGQYQFEDVQSFDEPANQFESQSQPIEPNQDFETAQYGAPSFEPAQETENYAPAASEVNYGSFEQQNDGAEDVGSDGAFNVNTVQETFVEAQPATEKPARSRFSDRNIDLPVEVSEDERRLHNDARRFARLLVSEIKLYNEQKVKEGRGESDLYERLREAIDRSREMYDKRVQPPVAAKFDYFHYELVNSLAEGDEAKLGETYVGAVA